MPTDRQIASKIFDTKKLLLVFCFAAACFLFAPSANAQTNPEINYQGKLTDSNGAAVADGAYGMEFKLYTVPTGGSAIWTETSTSTVTNGLFSVMLGSSTSLTSVDFNQTLYLGVNIQGDGEMSPRKIIGTVPAAFEARKLGGVASSSFLRSDQADTASGLLTFTGGLLSNSSSTITDLTSVTATTTNFIINGERFTDLTGTGLENFNNSLRVATTTLGLGDGTFLGLSDTFSSYTANRVLYTTGSGVASSSNLTFDGSTLTANELTLTTALAGTSGGTGLSSITQNQLLIGGAGNTWSQVATSSLGLGTIESGTAGYVPYYSGNKTLTATSTIFMAGVPQSTDTGWTDVGVGANVDDGSSNWANPGNITADDGNTADYSSGSDSDYLQGTSTGLSVPTGATIDGIEVRFELTGISDVNIGEVRLVDETGTRGATNRGTGNNPGTGFITYGSSTDLWGDTWSPADVNDPDFGFAVKATDRQTFGFISVDVFQVRVYYTVPGSSPRVAIGQTSADARLDVAALSGYDAFNVSSSTSGDLFTITGSGNVGIGSSTPSRLLTVAGNTYTQGLEFTSATGTNLTLGTTTSRGLLTVDGDLFVGTSSLPALFADVSTGRVGIGTTTPAYDLTVAGDTWLNGALYDSVNNSAGTNGYVLQATGSGTEWVATSSIGLGDGTFLGLSDTPGSYTANRLPFTNSAGDALTDSAGLTFDGDELKVSSAGVAGNDIILISASTSRQFSSPGFDLYGVRSVVDTSGISFAQADNTYAFYGAPSAAADTNWGIYLTGEDQNYFSGNVGIGTTSPSSKLDVWGDLRVGTSSLPALFADVSTGRVGIGTTTPAYDLTVAGDTWLNGALYDSVNNSAGVAGYVLQTTGSGTEWVATSSLGISGGGTADGNNYGPTVIVAASNASNTARAHFVADSTDDEETIQNAIDSLPTSGGTVELTEGLFNVGTTTYGTSVITLESNVRIMGQGTSTVLRLNDGAGDQVGILNAESKTNVSIKDLNLQGNQAGQTNSVHFGIRFFNTNWSLIDNVIANDFARDGVLITGASAHHNRIQNSTANDNNSDGFQISSSDNNTISQNIADGNNSAGFNMTSGDSNTFTGNVASNNGARGFYMSGSSDNTYAQNTAKGNGSSGGFEIDSSSNYNTFTGNTVSDNAGSGFDSDLSDHNTITGNTIRGNNQRGIYLSRGAHNTVSSNSLYGNGDSGVYASVVIQADSDENLITSNTISATSSDPLIEINSATGERNIIANNTYENSELDDSTFISDSGTNTRFDDYNRTTLTTATGVGYNLLNIYGSSTLALASTTQLGTGAIEEWGNSSGNVMTLDNSGNLLLGTSTSRGLLTVDGDFFVGTSSSPALFADTSTGRVGIGTTTPAYDLTVAGDTWLNGALYDSVNNSAGTSGQLLQTTAAGTQWIATSTLNIAISDTTGTLGATRGGTGLSSITQNQLLIGGAGNTWSQTATSSLGLGDGTFLGLSDTPNSYTANRILYTTASAVASSSDFTFDGTNLLLGTTTSRGLLTVDGDLFVGDTSLPTLFADVSTGNVGIGSSTPSYDLTVNNQIAVRNPSGSASLLLTGGAASTNFIANSTTTNLLSIAGGTGFADGSNFIVYGEDAATGAGDILLRYGSQNKDISTADVHFQYQSSGSTFTSIAKFTTTDIQLVPEGGGSVGIGDTGPDSLLEVSASGGASDLFMLSSDDANDGDRFIVKNDGSVGIGTTTPSTKLQLVANSNSTTDYPFTISNTADNYGLQVGAYGLSNKTFGASNIDYTMEFGGDLALMPSDNLGIGTTTPASKLTVAQSADANGLEITGFDDQSGNSGQLYVNSSGVFNIDAVGSVGAGQLVSNGSAVAAWTSNLFVVADNKELAFGDGNDYSWGYHSSTDSIRLVDGSNVATDANARLTVLNSGNVGVGTTTPDHLLSVAGDFFVGTSSLSTLFADVSTSRVGIGTTTPTNRLSVLETVDSPQVRVSYDGSRYATFKVDSAGDLVVAASGGNTFFNDDNVFICTGGSCPGGDPTGTGNLFVENKLGLGTTTPEAPLDVWSGAGVKIAQFFEAGVDMLVGALTFDSAPASDHSASGNIVSDIAASTTIAIGESVYLNSAGAWGLSDASASTTVSHLMGIAIEAGSNGTDIEVATDGAYVRDDSWNWTTGSNVYASTSPGVLTQTKPSGSGNVVRIIGVATSPDVIKLEYGSIIVLN